MNFTVTPVFINGCAMTILVVEPDFLFEKGRISALVLSV